MAQNILRNFSRELPKELSLFQNLSTNLAEGLLKLFSIYSPGGHLFNGAEPFEQFWLRVSQGTFL